MPKHRRNSSMMKLYLSTICILSNTAIVPPVTICQPLLKNSSLAYISRAQRPWLLNQTPFHELKTNKLLAIVQYMGAFITVFIITVGF